MKNPDEGGRLRAARRSILRPPSVIQSAASQSRAGESTPASDICATTAKTSPATTERKLPVAARTSKRPEHPRASTIPTPKSRPPMIAPDQLPGTAIMRASWVSIRPRSCAPWTQTRAVEKVRNQTATLSFMRPRANSTEAARRQNRERWAAIPKIRPVINPKSAAVGASPMRSMSGIMSIASRLFEPVSGGV